MATKRSILTVLCIAALSAESSAFDGHEQASFHQLSGHGGSIPVEEYRVALLFITAILAIKVVTHLGSSSDWLVRRTFWILMSSSVSVFLAIFTYSTTNTLFKSMMLHSGLGGKMTPTDRGYFGRVCAAIWYGVMVLGLSYFACLGRKQSRAQLINEPSMKQVVKNKMQSCLFMSHTAAFTGIEATCRIINEKTWKHGDATLDEVRGVVFRSILRYALFIVILSLLRSYILHHTIPDHHADELVEEWEEMVEEGEHHFFALMASFFVTLYLIFGITKKQIINSEGHESEDFNLYKHTYEHIGWLYMYAVLFLALSYAWGMFSREALGWKDQHHHDHRCTVRHQHLRDCKSCFHWACSRVTSSVKKRAGPLVTGFVLMIFSWCFFFATQWLVAKVMHEYDILDTYEVSPMMVSVWSVHVAGAFTTFIVLVVNWLCRGLNDQRVVMREVLDEMMLGMGFLIGFSWEQCFHEAISIVTGKLQEQKVPVEISTLVILMVFFALLYPLWRDSIIPMQTEKGYRLGYVPRWVRHRMLCVAEPTQMEWLESTILGITADLTPEQRRGLAEKLREYEPPQHTPAPPAIAAFAVPTGMTAAPTAGYQHL